MIRVVVAEDHALVRLGLVVLLKSSGRYEVVAETARGEGVEQLVREHAAHLLLLDLSLGDGCGLEVARRISKDMPGVRILVVTGHAAAASVSDAFSAGADGFLIKHAQGAELLDAADAVMDGKRYMSPQLGGAGVEAGPAAYHGHELTERERQVARMIAGGAGNQEIAQMLNIGVLTARRLRQGVTLKLAGPSLKLP